MRIGVISDTHSNVEAFRAVARALGDAGIARLICAGDVIGYGPRPNETTDLLRELLARTNRAFPDPVFGHVVAGNHDRFITGALDATWFNPAAAEALRWTRDEITDATREFLGALPDRVVISVDERSDGAALAIEVVHGRHDADEMTPLYTPYLQDAASAHLHLTAQTTPLSIVGHTHIAFVGVLEGGKLVTGRPAVPPGDKEMSRAELGSFSASRRVVMNPGSVGQPRDGDRRAAFAVVESDATSVRVEFHRVAYDDRAVSNEIDSRRLPHALGARLAVGR